MSKQFYFKQFSLAYVYSLNVKTVLFQPIQFNKSSQFSSIWPIDRTLSGATTPGQSGPGSDGNKGVLHIPQSSSITGTSPSDCLVVVSWKLIVGGERILLLCREAIGVFYSSSWPGQQGVGEGAAPFPGLLFFTLDPFFLMLNGGIKYHFWSLWYDSTWD